MALEPIKNISTNTVGSTQELQEIKDVETKEVQPSEAKALEEAKTKEDANVDVVITEEAPKEEKKGFWSTLGNAFKSLFASDNTAGKTAGGLFGSGSGVGLGAFIGSIVFGPIGALVGGLIGGLIGGVGGAMVGDNIQEYLENDGQIKDGKDPKAQDPKAGTTEETVDDDGNKIITEYDENGNKIKESKDINNDGSIENITTYEYNNQGQMIKKSVDYTGEETSKADGKPEYSKEYEYDDAGNLVKTTSKNDKGEIEDVQTSTYDENGNQITHLFDRDANGVKNGIDEYYEYSYNDKGQMTEIKYDGSDGKWNTTYEYDENGNKIKELIDNDLDGVPDRENEIKPEE